MNNSDDKQIGEAVSIMNRMLKSNIDSHFEMLNVIEVSKEEFEMKHPEIAAQFKMWRIRHIIRHAIQITGIVCVIGASILFGMYIG